MTYPNQQPPQWDPYSGQQPGYGAPQQPGYGAGQQPGPYGQPGYPAPGPYGPQYGYGAGGPGWGPGGAQPKPDIVSAIILVVAGAFGLLQFFTPWLSARGQSASGKDIADLAGLSSGMGLSSGAATMIQIAIWAVMIGGIALVLCGVVLFIPMRNRKIIGALALVVSVFMGAGAVIWLVDGTSNPDSTSFGYYLFLIAGLIGIIGSIVALVRK